MPLIEEIPPPSLPAQSLHPPATQGNAERESNANGVYGAKTIRAKRGVRGVKSREGRRKAELNYPILCVDVNDLRFQASGFLIGIRTVRQDDDKIAGKPQSRRRSV